MNRPVGLVPVMAPNFEAVPEVEVEDEASETTAEIGDVIRSETEALAAITTRETIEAVAFEIETIVAEKETLSASAIIGTMGLIAETPVAEVDQTFVVVVKEAESGTGETESLLTTVFLRPNCAEADPLICAPVAIREIDT